MAVKSESSEGMHIPGLQLSFPNWPWKDSRRLKAVDFSTHTAIPRSPYRFFYNSIRVSKSVDQRSLRTSKSSIDGFLGSKTAKGLVGIFLVHVLFSSLAVSFIQSHLRMNLLNSRTRQDWGKRRRRGGRKTTNPTEITTSCPRSSSCSSFRQKYSVYVLHTYQLLAACLLPRFAACASIPSTWSNIPQI